jgi:invasion protein IalB
MLKTTRLLLISTGILFIFALAATAQTSKRTSATYDDWTLNCVYAGEASPKSCQVLQAQPVQGQAAPTIRIAIVSASENQPFKIYFQMPPNVRIPFGVHLLGSGEETVVQAAFLWCAPSRCVAESDVSAQQLDKLSKGSQARIVFKDANERDLAVPISVKGLAQTLSAMNGAVTSSDKGK